MAIIKSMLDNDFYKLTMQQVVFKKFPDLEVEYTFKNRTKGINLSYLEYAGKIADEILKISKLKFLNTDIDYLRSIGLFSKGYLEYLKRFTFNPDNIYISEGIGGILDIKIKGTWLNTILWEVPLLAIISELYSNSMYPKESTKINGLKTNEYFKGHNNLDSKIDMITIYNNGVDKFYTPLHLDDIEHRIKHKNKWITFVDFGTRRRYSRTYQEYVVKTLSKDLPTSFIGTSNVHLSKKYEVKPIGTMAHEFIQAMQSIVRLCDSQKYAFQTWADVYRGDLGIALSDTLGMNTFFNDFDMYFAKLFDGARHDSGNPDVWCDRLIEHYESMDINPLTKTAVFSDGLIFPEMIRLHKKYSNKIKVSFGIGTNLTNDCGIKPLQIVIKMTKCDGKPVAKISDSKGKQMCEDKSYLKYLASQFNIPEDRL